ncbi:MAG TPA: TylF/MycF/NovP-related O-methyltransferase [Solirubrobacteraceae bacterium]
MMELPDFSRSWEYENNFYLSCDATRISKLLAHYELMRSVAGLPGAIVECGVFKGASLARFAMFRELFGNAHGKRIIGFDAFGAFPETAFADDVAHRSEFVATAGESGVSVAQMEEVLRHKGVHENVELIAGDINVTVPEYAARNPELRISLLNLDTDIYEPAVTVLEHLYPRVVRGGVLILDDYTTWPGETAAVDEYFAGQGVTIEKFEFAMTPCFVRKT